MPFKLELQLMISFVINRSAKYSSHQEIVWSIQILETIETFFSQYLKVKIDVLKCLVLSVQRPKILS